jgi:hydrogenase expression/formation protein HypC
MKIKKIDGYQCTCEAKGIEREVSLFMLQHEALAPGDHILVHVGYAIQKVSEQDAADSWALFDQVLAADI